MIICSSLTLCCWLFEIQFLRGTKKINGEADLEDKTQLSQQASVIQEPIGGARGTFFNAVHQASMMISKGMPILLASLPQPVEHEWLDHPSHFPFHISHSLLSGFSAMEIPFYHLNHEGLSF